jgi:predicted DNA-binding transcriptional regulator YafY
MLTFKVDRIKDIKLLEEHYSIPQDFDANEHLESAWGIAVYGKPVAIKLRFNAVIAQIAGETKWHPSQAVKMQPDGSAVVSFKVPVTDEFIAFVTRWGEKVEVLQPLGLRKEIAGIARGMLRQYD